MRYYDENERALIESIENGEWDSVNNLASEIAEAKKIAKATRTKDVRINIRLNSGDLKALKSKALEEGIPYQTLVSSILHKYAAGKLKDESSSNKQ
jgi:predicted DNA binding CopG/RHH family protein